MRNGDEFAELNELQRTVEGGSRIVALDGLTSTAAKAFVLSKLKAPGKTIVVVTDTNASLEDWESDLAFWTDAAGSESNNSSIV